MINPCNAQQQYIQFKPIYQIPTHYGNRITSEYVNPTPELFEKHKLLLLKHTTRTNGPGKLKINNTTTQISYRLDIDSIQYKNRIYKIPCRFKEYLPLIKSFISQGVTIQNILEYLRTKYNIADLSLKQSSYQNKRLYTYPYANVNAPKKDLNSVSDNAPFIIGETVNMDLQTIINDIDIPPNMNITPQYSRVIYVSNNDGKSYTTKFNDLLPNGSASFFGASLLDNMPIKNKWQISVFIIPHPQTHVKSYGYIVDSSKYSINKGLIFIPLQSYESLLIYKPYPTGMPFTIKINYNEQLNMYSIPCKFNQYAS